MNPVRNEPCAGLGGGWPPNEPSPLRGSVGLRWPLLFIRSLDPGLHFRSLYGIPTSFRSMRPLLWAPVLCHAPPLAFVSNSRQR